MRKKRTTFSAWFARRGGLFANLGWLAGVAFAAPSVWAAANDPVWVAALALGAAALPAVAGIGLSARMGRPFERFIIAMIWTALAAGVAASFGGVLGAAAFAFLLPPAAAAAGGSRASIIKSAALSGCAVIAVAGLQIAGFVAPAPQAALILAPFLPGAALMIAIAFSAAALRAVLAGDAARAEAEHGRLRSRAFDYAPAALVACDSDGNMIAASAGMRAVSPGLPRDLSNLPYDSLGYEDEDRSRLAGYGRRAGARKIEDEITLRGRGGRPAKLRLEAAPMPGGSVSVFSPDDAAASQAAIEAARLERDRAIEEARAKSQYLASVSHELRTPLNAIVGFSDVMKARLFGPLPARYAEYADLIHESGQHLMELIGDVLDMSKIEADRYELTPEVFDVGEVVSICVKLMRLQAEEKGLTLSVEGLGEGIEVKADRRALRQILLNLLSNSVKFTPEGGAIVVMARASGPNLVLAVGDSGVGISTEDAARLGKPYQQAKSAQDTEQRGTGLGLSLVRAIAELHDGSMSIASRPGEGTTITLTLPVLTEPRGGSGAVQPLDVHDRIRRAQHAGSSIASAK